MAKYGFRDGSTLVIHVGELTYIMVRGYERACPYELHTQHSINPATAVYDTIVDIID